MDESKQSQEIAERLGERFRPYLNLDKINRAIDMPNCPCKPLVGSDGHKMLAQEFIGNLIRPALDEPQAEIARLRELVARLCRNLDEHIIVTRRAAEQLTSNVRPMKEAEQAIIDARAILEGKK